MDLDMIIDDGEQVGIDMDAHVIVDNGMLGIGINIQDLVKEYSLDMLEDIKSWLYALDKLPIVVDHIDEVISTIRSSKSPTQAAEELTKLLDIDDRTSEIIVNFPLGELTSLTKRDIQYEKKGILEKVYEIAEIWPKGKK